MDTPFLSICEFSALTGIEQHTLRHYDNCKIFSPAMRGKNNYRYYSPPQLITAKFLGALFDLGVPLSEIKRMNQSRTPKELLLILEQQEDELIRKLGEIQEAFSIINTFRKNIQTGLSIKGGEIRVEVLNDTRFILGSKAKFGNDGFLKPFMAFHASASECRINLRYPVGGYYLGMDEFLKKPGQPESFFSLDPSGNKCRPQGKYLVGYHRGYYSEFGDFPQKMIDYARENNINTEGPLFIVYLLDEISEVKPENYLAQITIAICDK
jgi:DNA-binding transcriptional MerR regulator